MSQHILTTTLNGSPVQLVIGWDRPLKQYFYNLFNTAPGANDALIASSRELDQDELYDLDPILEDLKRFDIEIPEKLIDEVQADEVNREGNRVVHY